MKNILLICMLFTLAKSREISSLATIDNSKKPNYSMIVDSSSIINGLYKNLKVIPSIDGYAFSYKHTYSPKSKIIKIVCTKKIDGTNVEYDVELKDTKGVYNRNSFSIGDDYKYITSYFLFDGIKLSLNKVHALNSEDDFLTQISNIWSGDKTFATTKYYSIKKKKIILIKGIDPFCNGHNCTDYVVYVLQKENGKGSVNAIHFDGTNGPYDFNNFKLFYDADGVNTAMLIPKNSRPVKSKHDVDMYKINFDSIKR
ncbi:hypothetical protein [Mucilaginibacter kameinonensis]|uniref:hypothetical protein n=1 Tax=Mucilaginibacter kameinonensis TaxID=452286 RepID=UPI000EF77FE9|nr:hypothetical protein [Mucilaginibacter kameinonensis]